MATCEQRTELIEDTAVMIATHGGMNLFSSTIVGRIAREHFDHRRQGSAQGMTSFRFVSADRLADLGDARVVELLRH